MCYHNHILHNGCGHKQPIKGSRQFTLCEAARQRLPKPPAAAAPSHAQKKTHRAAALQRLESKRGTTAAADAGSESSTTPPPPPPKDDVPAMSSGALRGVSMDGGRPGGQNQQKRSSFQMLERHASGLKRLGSQAIRRMPTISSSSPSRGRSHGMSIRIPGNRTTTTTNGTNGTGSTSVAPNGNGNLRSSNELAQQQQMPTSPFEEYTLMTSPLETAAVLCSGEELKVVEQREEKMDVCERCRKVINEMRWLVEAYDEKRNIRGCRAYWYVDVPRSDD